MRDKTRFKSGDKEGRLTLLRVVGRRKGRALWLCLCECGNEKIVNSQSFSHGTSRSCGCLKKEHAYRIGKARIGINGNSARNIVISWYKTHGHSKKHEWAITDEYTEHLLVSNCFYCGSAPSVKKETQSGIFVHGGIDRIDSDKGYILGNVVPCCWMCNCMKNKFSKELFLSQIEKIASRLINKNQPQVEV